MDTKKAMFAGGCFWCMEGPFEKLNGVKNVMSGYTGGDEENPTYEEVCSGQTGHLEAIEVVYDFNLVKYEQLLDIFWKSIDPTQDDGQFADIGHQYSTAIFYTDQDQKEKAEASKIKLANSGVFDKPIATQILKAKKFYPAEDYHQGYHKKNPTHYQMYRVGSGREGFLKNKWGEK